MQSRRRDSRQAYVRLVERRPEGGSAVAFRFLDGEGRDVPDDVAAKSPVLLVGDEATGDPEVALAFRDVKTFRAWAETSPIAERVDDVYRTLREQVLPQKANEAWIEKMHTLALTRKQDDVK